MLLAKRSVLGLVAIAAILAGCGTTTVVESSTSSGGARSGGASGGGRPTATIELAAPVEIPLGIALQSTTQLVTADINGDGHLDIFTLTYAGDVGVAKNAGDGSFGSFTRITGAGMGAKMTVADVDGDGRADVLLTPDDSIHVTFGAPDGTPPRTKTTAPLLQVELAQVVTADLKGDGTLEALICSRDYIWRVALDGKSIAEQVAGGPSGVCATADLDGNGRPDLIVANGGTVNTWLTDSNGESFDHQPRPRLLWLCAFALDCRPR